MRLNVLFVITAVITLVFGLAFVLVPTQLATLFGVDLNEGGVFIGRLFGAALLGFCVLAWFVRDAEASDTRGAIVLSYFIGDAIGFIVALIAQLANVMNALGWIIVVIYLLLALGFGYFRFLSPSTAEPGLSG